MAGSRIYVQEGIYDQFLQEFTNIAESLTKAIGGPFEQGVLHGPQISKTQFDVSLSRYLSPMNIFNGRDIARHGIYQFREGRRRSGPYRWRETWRNRILCKTYGFRRRETRHENHARRDIWSGLLHCQVQDRRR